jgi:hypothetical protein
MSHCPFEVFGTLVDVERRGVGWVAFFPGADGRRRRANIEIPDFLSESELCQYLADMFHESASPSHPDTFRIA